MKSGIVASGGIGGSCCGFSFDVWGTSLNAPNFANVDLNEHGDSLNGVNLRDLSFPYIPNSWNGSYGHTAYKEVEPELFPKVIDQPFVLYAARVPSSYPQVESCNVDNAIAISSSSDGGDNSWTGTICNIARYHEHTVEEETYYDFTEGWEWCIGSRAIYVDGEQKYICYRTTGRSPVTNSAVNRSGPPRPNLTPVGEVHIFEITNPETNNWHYKTSELAGQIYTNINPTGTPTVMEEEYENWEPNNVVEFGGAASAENYQPPANAISYGKEYFAGSSYYPGCEGISGWAVMRIKYEGTRLGEAGLEVFGSQSDLGLSGTSYDGTFVIVLPSCRVYIDSASDQPDEPWVIAKTVSGTLKVVCSKWQSKRYRPGVGSEDEETGVADGTLSDTEVSSGELILDASDSPIEDEDWSNFQVRCYNHQYGKNIVLATTGGGSTSSAPPFTADFEGSLNSGLPTGIAFKTYGTDAQYTHWTYDNGESHSGTYGAMTEFQDVTLLDNCVLELSFTLLNDGNVTGYYICDNRWYGSRFPGLFGPALLNTPPDPDNHLSILVDGKVLTSGFLIEGVEQASSVIDNVNVPGLADGTDAWFEDWRSFSIPLTAGTHTIKFMLVQRYQTNGHLKAWLDDIYVPDTMAGTDYNSTKRYLYDGDQWIELTEWAWPAREEESSTSISERISTVPDFATLDKYGRIYIGNPHYMYRMVYDELLTKYVLDDTFGGPRGPGFPESTGYWRWSASPNISPPEPPCEDPDSVVAGFDQISDPPWGAFQILPTGLNVQVRGANGAARDAYKDPISRDTFTYKHPVSNEIKKEDFRNLLYCRDSSMWGQRISGWTIANDGTAGIPHIEVIFRPTLDLPAWPDPPNLGATPKWPSPPYRSDFESSDTLTPYAPYSVRPRDPLQLPEGSNKSRWSVINFVVPRTYSDAWSRKPQLVWVRMVDDPEEGDPSYWNPDDPVVGGPYNSAIWRMCQARFNPNGFKYWVTGITGYIDNLCSGDESDPTFTWGDVWRNVLYENSGVFDFDAVECGCEACNCCISPDIPAEEPDIVPAISPGPGKGAVLYYRMQDTENTKTVQDASAPAANGTMTTSTCDVITTSGPGSNLSYAFDCSGFESLGDAISIPEYSIGEVAGVVWEFIAKRNNTSGQHIVLGNTSEDQYIGFEGGSDYITVKTSGGTYSMDTGQDTTQWHHYAFWFQGNKNIDVYIDGSAIGSISTGRSGTAAFNQIGYSGYLSKGFNGKLCAVTYYDGNRNSTQMTIDANEGGL